MPLADLVQYVKFPKNGKAQSIGSAAGLYTPSARCFWADKEVTVSVFNSNLKKAVGTKEVEVKDSDWYTNTAADRAKMSSLVKW